MKYNNINIVNNIVTIIVSYYSSLFNFCNKNRKLETIRIIMIKITLNIKNQNFIRFLL